MTNEQKSVYEKLCDYAKEGDVLSQELIKDVNVQIKNLLDFTSEDVEKNAFYLEMLYLLENAKEGNTEKQYLLGLACYNGLCGDKFPAEALKWFTLAAQGGYAPAQAMLGELHYFGSKNAKDKGYGGKCVEGLYWLREAAKQGSIEAIHALGIIEKDINKITIAAEAGLLDAQFNLGNKLTAIGNHAEAFEWYKKAALQNDPDAQNALVFMYHNGKGVEQDKNKAHQWFEKFITNYVSEF